MSRYADDDDSFEAAEYRSYKDWCPEGVKLDWFIEMSRQIIAYYKAADTPPAPQKINGQLKKLNGLIKKLSPETLKVLRGREQDHWQSMRPVETLYDEAWFQRTQEVTGGGAALGIIAKTSAGKFKPRKKGVAANKRDLISRAAFVFKLDGTEISAAVDGKFVQYIHHLFVEAGIPDEGPKGDTNHPKAVRDFLAECEIEKTKHPSKKIYRLKYR